MLGKLFFRSFSSHSQSYDIVINGGGIVGLSLLLRLQNSPFLADKRLLLLEQSPKIKYVAPNVNQERILSNRVSSLTQDTRHFFELLDIWSEIKPFVRPINSMHVWSRNYNRGITFTPSSFSIFQNSISASKVCYITENDIIINALVKNINHKLIRFESNVKSIIGSDEIVLALENNENISTKLLIGCDGHDSLVRKSSSFKYFNHDLKQRAIVGTVELSQSYPNDIAYQRFVPHLNSVLAILPLTETMASFVYSCKIDESEHLMSLSDDEFISYLNDALMKTYSNESNVFDYLIHAELISQLLTNIQPPRVVAPEIIRIEPNSRSSFPLQFGTTLPWMVGCLKGSDKKVVIIGDAAHKVHPLAGQGLNLGLGDASVLAECLEESIKNGDNPLYEQHLNEWLIEFENRRVGKLITMMAAISSMETLFNYVPNGFIDLFNRMNWLKSEIVRFANKN